MTTALQTVFEAARNWDGFRIEPAKSDSTTVFGLAQFLSTLALLVVVFNVTDFRYRYRLFVRRYDVRSVGIIVSTALAVLLLLTELWFQNAFLLPHFLNNYGNIKLLLATVFVILVIYVVQACFLWHAAFRRSNAVPFFRATNFYIHQGHKDRLQAIAEELTSSIEDIFRTASKIPLGEAAKAPSLHHACAHDLLLTIADRRFCNVIVDRVPSFAIRCFELADQYQNAPFSQFSHNIGEEFIVNTESAFYQEDSGYHSGYFGYAKPITRAVFGCYELIERCASAGVSPLDLRYVGTLNATQMDGFTRAGLSFFNAYLAKTSAQSHSYALARLLGSLTGCVSELYKINNLSTDESNAPEFARFKSAADFLKEAINSLAKSGIKARSLRPSKETYHDVYDALAHAIMDLIFAAATVDVASFLCWHVQHNIAWNILSSFDDNYTRSVLNFKVRRLIYDNIIDHSGNFLGARYLGFCLHVCGLTPGNRHKNLERKDYALRVCVINWTKKNYKTLLADHPKVARACLHGTITYDPDKHRLVKTFHNATRKDLPSETLALD